MKWSLRCCEQLQQRQRQPQLQVCVVCVQSSVLKSPCPCPLPLALSAPRLAAQQFNLSFVRNLRNASPPKAWERERESAVCVNSYNRQLMLSLSPPPVSLSHTASAAPALSILHTACLANILEIRVLRSVQVSLYACSLSLFIPLSFCLSL